MFNKIKPITISRSIFIAGLFVIGLSIFIDTYKVAALSSLKAGKERLKLELSNKYKIKPPDQPIDESKYILPPDEPVDDATDEEKSDYTKLNQEYEQKKESLEEEYNKSRKEYELEYKKYNRKQKELNLKKKRDKREYNREKRELTEKIKDYEISINDFSFSVILRFLGSILFLMGSLGILLRGDNYERVGVLFAIGFGIKTILGL